MASTFGYPPASDTTRVIEHHDDRPPGGQRRRFTPARIPREVGYKLPAAPPAIADPAGLFGDSPLRPAVGVIDTGVVLHQGVPHTYLQGRVSYGVPADVDDDNASAADGHGSFVAGVILQEAPTALLQMKGVIDKSTGKWEDQAVARAIIELGTSGVPLINLSFSGDPEETQTPSVIVEALEGLDPNVVVVASGGNNPSDQPAYPAAQSLGKGHALLLAVGASDDNQHAIANFSCHGDWVTLYANGSDVLGPFRGDEWVRWSGTSFACATVTGRIAAAMTDPFNARTAAEQVLAEAASHPIQDGAITRPHVQSLPR